MEYIQHGFDTYNWAWDQRDLRVDYLPLMSNVLPIIGVCCFYVYLVKFLGPQYMEKRSPYELK